MTDYSIPQWVQGLFSGTFEIPSPKRAGVEASVPWPWKVDTVCQIVFSLAIQIAN